MASELRFAVRCGSRQRPATKQRISREGHLPCPRCSPGASIRRGRYCSHEETTYVPSIELPRLNGVSRVLPDGFPGSRGSPSPFSLLNLHPFHSLFLVPRNHERNPQISVRIPRELAREGKQAKEVSVKRCRESLIFFSIYT